MTAEMYFSPFDFSQLFELAFLSKYFAMPEVGVEPTPALADNILSVACLPFHHPGLEVRAGIEPAYCGFADRCVTTSPPHLA